MTVSIYQAQWEIAAPHLSLHALIAEAKTLLPGMLAAAEYRPVGLPAWNRPYPGDVLYAYIPVVARDMQLDERPWETRDAYAADVLDPIEHAQEVRELAGPHLWLMRAAV